MSDNNTQLERHFWRQDAAQNALVRARDRKRLSTSYLFVGPEGAGKWAAAQWVAKAHLCEQEDHTQAPCGTCDGCRRVDSFTHPDLHILFPVPGKDDDNEQRSAVLDMRRADPFAVVHFSRKPNIRIERVRELQAELSKTAVERGPKVAIIAAADQMHHDVHGILLKSIEEPPKGAHFILTTADPGRIPQTIHSRCQTIRFTAVDPAAIAERLIADGLAEPDDAAQIAQLADGGWGMAKLLATEESREWRSTAAGVWDAFFAPQTSAALEQVESIFKGKSFDETVLAFDVWSLLLWRECKALDQVTPRRSRMPDLVTAWSCWKILQQGRATLWVNVIPRNAVRGTVIALRRRLGLA